MGKNTLTSAAVHFGIQYVIEPLQARVLDALEPDPSRRAIVRELIISRPTMSASATQLELFGDVEWIGHEAMPRSRGDCLNDGKKERRRCTAQARMFRRELDMLASLAAGKKMRGLLSQQDRSRILATRVELLGLDLPTVTATTRMATPIREAYEEICSRVLDAADLLDCVSLVKALKYADGLIYGLLRGRRVQIRKKAIENSIVLAERAARSRRTPSERRDTPTRERRRKSRRRSGRSPSK